MPEIPSDCKSCNSYIKWSASGCPFLRDYCIGTDMEYPELNIYHHQCPCRECLIKMMCDIGCEDYNMLLSIYTQKETR